MTEPITIAPEDYDDLLARHPWIRSRDPYAYLSRGWASLVAAMLDDMDAVMAGHPGGGVHDWYTKEKFGGLRVHFRLDGVSNAEGVWAALRRPIDSAEQASLKTCEICGAPGRLRRSRGWLSTRCDDHVGGG